MAEHTTPQFVAAFRLLPAGLALLAWAHSRRRPMPRGWKAWAWVVAFALVDGTAFQVRGEGQLHLKPTSAVRYV